ncbi:hypothetical protein GF342_00575 [Candidatus Woesearchaeota archaeon]|nr:hypothetical protein [Candidatus Woesearchaeota archaeon]
MYEQQSAGYGTSGTQSSGGSYVLRNIAQPYLRSGLSNQTTMSYTDTNRLSTIMSYTADEGPGWSRNSLYAHLPNQMEMARPVAQQAMDAKDVFSHLQASNSVFASRAAAPAVYRSTPYTVGLYLTNVPTQHVEVRHAFLSPGRPSTQFVGTTKEVEEHVHKAFKKITKQAFPKNIKIVICSKEELTARHSGQWSEGMLGFSLNRQGRGVNEIYVKKNNLDVLMLTIGHEIGHVMSPTLSDPHDEEAKAFAFEIAWLQTIAKHNIAGLSQSFTPSPAKNGLHDVAFGFVQYLMESGRTALQVFSDLVCGRSTITRKLERLVR